MRSVNAYVFKTVLFVKFNISLYFSVMGDRPYCSLLLAQNVPIQTVSKYMGHSDSTVTLKVYSHFIPDTQEKVVFALNNLTKQND